MAERRRQFRNLNAISFCSRSGLWGYLLQLRDVLAHEEKLFIFFSYSINFSPLLIKCVLQLWANFSTADFHVQLPDDIIIRQQEPSPGPGTAYASYAYFIGLHSNLLYLPCTLNMWKSLCRHTWPMIFKLFGSELRKSPVIYLLSQQNDSFWILIFGISLDWIFCRYVPGYLLVGYLTKACLFAFSFLRGHIDSANTWKDRFKLFKRRRKVCYKF